MKIKSLNGSSCPWIFAFSSVACVEYECRICFKDKILLRAMFVFQRLLLGGFPAVLSLFLFVSLSVQISLDFTGESSEDFSLVFKRRRASVNPHAEVISPPALHRSSSLPVAVCIYSHLSHRGNVFQPFVTTWHISLLPLCLVPGYLLPVPAQKSRPTG